MTGLEMATGLDAWVAHGAEITAAEEAERARMRGMRFDTIAVHGIYSAEAALAHQGSLIEPAYLSPAQHFADSDHLEAALGYLMPAWGYTRIANPTLHYLEETLALLEAYGTGIVASAVVTGSGMAAVDMAVTPLLADDGTGRRPSVVVGAKCYGGTFQLFRERFARERGVDVRWVREPLDTAEWARLVDGSTRLLYGEMPSNPSLSVLDVPAVSRIAHDAGVPLVVDATVATPALLRPLGLGADIVVHSVSKSIAASGLAIAGAVVARRGIVSRWGSDEMRDDFALHVKLLPMRDHGPALSPFNALMALTDLRTLRGRMDAWSRSAGRVAAFLEAHPAVERVHYPGLASDPGHGVAARDMWLADGADGEGEPANRFGHLLAFTVRGGQPAARRVLDGLRLVRRATDLGRVKSVATIPSISTHQQQGEEGRAIADVPPRLIRLSVGAEHPGDVEDDLAAALARA
ncbi:MAG: PLP-dependent transferase [Chloroflexi bacterium]|nr:PLP-dependent transferase [Chloroflexota bacterium]